VEGVEGDAVLRVEAVLLGEFSTTLGYADFVAYNVVGIMSKYSSIMNASSNLIPTNEQQALQLLLPTLDQPVQLLPAEAFKQAWAAVFYLYGGLHPDEATDHGAQLITAYDGQEEYRALDARLVVPRYVQSGWPVVLAPLAQEAWRRHELAQLTDDELYCSEAQHAGFMERMKG
jgi:hypothetical protein